MKNKKIRKGIIIGVIAIVVLCLGVIMIEYNREKKILATGLCPKCGMLCSDYAVNSTFGCGEYFNVDISELNVIEEN